MLPPTLLSTTPVQDAADLLKKLLHFNPKKRLTAAEALKHPYVAQFHNSADEPSCSRRVTIPIDDNTKVSCLSALREVVWMGLVLAGRGAGRVLALGWSPLSVVSLLSGALP